MQKEGLAALAVVHLTAMLGALPEMATESRLRVGKSSRKEWQHLQVIIFVVDGLFLPRPQ